jgi:multiple sugar transport system substrate-binding protein
VIKGFNRKSIFGMIAALLVLSLVVAGCSGNNNSNNNASATNGSKTTGEKSKVSFWYLWGGAEGEQVENLIKRFNESQDKYVVEGLSVPDEQKIKIAIASGKGPDFTDSFASNVALYASQGIALELDSLIERDGYDLSQFIPASLAQGKYEGKYHAFPMNTTVNGLFYNKKLLTEAGYTEPPKTSQELYDMAVKLTKTNEDGTIEQLGFPSYPNFAFQALAIGMGGEYISQDGKTALFDSEANLRALQMIYDYNQKFGIDNIKRMQGSGKWLDPTDPFMMGKQAFRIDGPWLSTFMKNNNISVDYGVVPIPYLEGHPEYAGSGDNASSIFYIAKNSKNVDGAWEFMKFMFSSGELATFAGGMGNIPANMESMKDPIFDSIADSKEFMEISRNPNIKSLPNVEKLSEILTNVVNEEVEKSTNLQQKPEETIAKVQERMKELLK